MSKSDIAGQTLTILSGLVVRGAFDSAIVPGFQATTGCTVAVDWVPTTLIMQQVPGGQRADILIVTRAAMDQLVALGLMDAASRIELVHSRIGLAVPAGAPHPDITTPERFSSALQTARSVAYSRAGASGIHFETVLDKLGISEAVRSKATVIPAGFTAEKLVSGEADLAVQQVSELLVVPGIEVVGRFPEDLQTVSSFSAAVMRDAPQPEAAKQFLASLTTPEAVKVYLVTGVDPAF